MKKIRCNLNLPVDFVYTWVDGGNQDYQTLYREYSRKKTDLNPERFRDIYGLLRYSLRSVETYTPWYRNIYIITQRPQVPDWLDVSHPKIRIIHHDEIFDSNYLPTFNSNAIESFIHRIPGLSDNFLYLNDDFLFGCRTTLGDFITDDKKVKIYGTLLGERLKFRVYSRKWDIISYGFIEHTPLFIRKHAWRSMMTDRKECVHRTRLNKFRHDDDLAMDKLYRYYMLSKMGESCRVVPAMTVLKFHRFHKITNNVARQQNSFLRLRQMRPKFYCLNDDQRECPDQAVVEIVRKHLEQSYPEPSSFEKNVPRP
jgi:hypothetical protein